MRSPLSLKVVLPLLLGIVASLAIAVYSEIGYRRLELANRQMAAALELNASFNELFALIVDAESGQRGFLLTGKDEYLAPYAAALPKFDGAFSRLRELLVTDGTQAQRDTLGRLHTLTGKRLAELETAIALHRNGNVGAAQVLTETGIGKRAMEEIRAEVEGLTVTHRRQLAEAADRWASDVAFARTGMQVMTSFTVFLLVVVWLLARREAQQRETRHRNAERDNQRLEALVEDRTAELTALSNHLQVVSEVEKSRLARDIHDELGGILVSAKMDVAWVEDRLRNSDPDIADKLAPELADKLSRALHALDEGVAVKRRIIEDLRPTLLDNLGLSAALDWQVHEVCDRAGLSCTIETPADDSAIPAPVSIALYRIVQEALTNIVKYAGARNVNVDLGLGSDSISLLIEDDGIGIPADAQRNLLSHGIAGMRQRVRALRGEFSISRGVHGGTIIEVVVPLGESVIQVEASRLGSTLA
ncbi:MAG: CHASE3 domain-containing protein [Burkholderiales bacterium]|nr:CHASE3 domain-containing protein [Burkholderiales bacterium]